MYLHDGSQSHGNSQYLMAASRYLS